MKNQKLLFVKVLVFLLFVNLPLWIMAQSNDEFDDYTSNYTLNDDAMNNTISVLLEAYEKLGNEAYLEAARRGGDFFMISQGPVDQPAWSEQYDMKIQPDWARTHEPPAYGTRQTVHTIEMLEKLFLFTGDERYLRPIPATLDWIESSKLRVLENGMYELARYYHPGTNLPIRKEFLEERSREGYITYHYYPDPEKPFTGARHNVNFIELQENFQYISDVTQKNVKELDLKVYRYRVADLLKIISDEEPKPEIPDESEVQKLIDAMNNNGMWIEEISVHDMEKTMLTEDYRKMISGISTHTFIENMRILLRYIQYPK